MKIEFKVRSNLTLKIPSYITDDMIIFNAPRPLVGDVMWEGEFLSGRFYAACKPTSEFFKLNVKTNKAMDACVVVRLNIDDVKEWVKKTYPIKQKVILNDYIMFDYVLTLYLDRYNKTNKEIEI